MVLPVYLAMKPVVGATPFLADPLVRNYRKLFGFGVFGGADSDERVLVGGRALLRRAVNEIHCTISSRIGLVDTAEDELPGARFVWLQR